MKTVWKTTGATALTLTEDDLGVLERADHLEKNFRAGIFPRGAGHGRFSKLARHDLLAFTGHGRDVDGEIEQDVAVYCLTPLARLVLDQRSSAFRRSCFGSRRLTKGSTRHRGSAARDVCSEASNALADVLLDLNLDPAPVPMRIHCPICGTQHVDAGELATKPHKSHTCQNQSCGLTWKVANVPTVGVRFLPGSNDVEPTT